MSPTGAFEHQSDVAVIGLAGRFPGAADLETFWAHLRSGVESISFFTEQQLADSGVPLELARAPDYVRAKGIIPDVESFDAALFGMTPREAETMDPQQRLFLECCWEAVESAGYDFHRDDHRVGIYAGGGTSTYLLAALMADPNLLQRVNALQVRLGNDRDFLTTRVSYQLNLRGPSVTVQTACSTSLVAVHLACQALLDGECDFALAGGVTVSFPQVSGYTYQDGGIWSTDGHCRAFDAQATGAVEGNGAGVIVLRRLADATRSGDTVHAVIKGSAINNDGSRKAGFTAPGVESQMRVVTEARSLAGVDARTIGYVETHGSGTPIGDPIEVEALTRAFRAHTRDNGFCALGSVKPNVGHLDNAAGITSLIKTVLMLRHGEIVPLVNFSAANPKIALAASPFYIPTTASAWPRGDTPRRAGVSSLGIGGTNAHVIVEEPPEPRCSTPAGSWSLLTLSAHSAPAADAMRANLAAFLTRHPGVNLADVAHTLLVGRAQLAHRRALVARDVASAADGLIAGDSRLRRSTSRGVGDEPSVSFVFPGLGDQYVGLGAELYLHQQTFRAAVDKCAEILAPLLGVDIRDVLFPGGASLHGVKETPHARTLRDLVGGGEPVPSDAARKLNQTYLAQPAVFVLEYALARCLMSSGVCPRAMLGYSIGEYTAACLAGVMSLEGALLLVATRARLIQELPSGAMLAVPLSESELCPLLTADVSLAVSSGPFLSVVAGHHEAIERLQARAADAGVACRRLVTTHAFHSGMMEPILERFSRVVEQVDLSTPSIPFLSNVTGTWIAPGEATAPAYWVRHLRDTVRFGDGLGELLRTPHCLLVEVGPGRSLSAVAKQHPAWNAQVTVPTLPDRMEGGSELASLLDALGHLWVNGVPIDMTDRSPSGGRRRIPLPTYPFERQRYSIAAVRVPEPLARVPEGTRTDWVYVPIWRETRPPELLAFPAGGDADPWLVFLNGDAVVTALADQIERQGRRVVRVSQSREFAMRSGLWFEIRPEHPEDYDRLLSELDALDLAPQTVVFGACGSESSAEVAATDLFGRLLFLVQAAGDRDRWRPLRLVVVTRQMCDVSGAETTLPAMSALWGMCKVAPQEYANLKCKCIDLCAAPGDDHARADRLRIEIERGPDDALVAYRGRRWVQEFTRIRLDATERTPPREHGVFLIAGGLSETGLQIAEHLAQAYRARLVLVAADFPPRDQWAHWLGSHDADDPLSHRIRRVNALEAAGTAVQVLVLDLAMPERAASAVRHALSHFGELHGVVVAATSPGAGLIRFKTLQMAADVFRERVSAVVALSAAIADVPLDFFVVCSSIAAVTGGIGQVDVCAADAFVDAFLRRKNAAGDGIYASIRWSSLQWDVTWQLPGFQALEARIADSLRASAITAQDFKEILDPLLSSRLPDAIVSPRELAAVLRETDAFTVVEAIESLAIESGDMHARPDLSTPYAAPQTATEATIAALWQEAFGLERVGRHDNFFELAGTSLLAIQIVTRLRRVFNLDVPVTILFDASTVGAVAERIDLMRASGELDELLGEIEQLTPEEAERQIAIEREVD